MDAGGLWPGGGRPGAAEDAIQLRRVGVGAVLAAAGGLPAGAGGAWQAGRRPVPGGDDCRGGDHDAALRALDAAGIRRDTGGGVARRRPDGAVELLGRLDGQVKVRGVRIERGEIEAALASLGGVREAVVVAREDRPGDVRLVAYVVPSPGADPCPEVLREALRERLPEPMIPSAFVILASLPLSPNGKVDRRALPAPVFATTGTEALRTPVEEVLA